MTHILDEFYKKFYENPKLPALRESVEEKHKILICNLSKADRKTVLKIIDALDMICCYQTKDSFMQGFKLGVELATELQNYNTHSFEQDELKACGYSFMSQDIGDK